MLQIHSKPRKNVNSMYFQYNALFVHACVICMPECILRASPMYVIAFILVHHYSLNVPAFVLGKH